MRLNVLHSRMHVFIPKHIYVRLHPWLHVLAYWWRSSFMYSCMWRTRTCMQAMYVMHVCMHARHVCMYWIYFCSPWPTQQNPMSLFAGVHVCVCVCMPRLVRRNAQRLHWKCGPSHRRTDNVASTIFEFIRKGNLRCRMWIYNTCKRCKFNSAYYMVPPDSQGGD